MPRKKLQWGQTPFHRMTKAQLLQHSVKMYDALVAARSTLRQYELGNEHNPYWSREGSGRKSLEKANQVVEPMEAQYGADQIYRMFYRYSMDLLWHEERANLHWNWMVCPTCGMMVANENKNGMPCHEAIGLGREKCHGTLRPITWDDLKPQQPKEQ